MGAAYDVAMGGVLLHSWNMVADQHLKEWVIGSLLLGFPTSALVHATADETSFRKAFLLEAGANVASFAWLAAGMLWVSKSTAYKTAPMLFWSVYVTCVTSWSILGTALMGLILSTVVAILYGKG